MKHQLELSHIVWPCNALRRNLCATFSRAFCVANRSVPRQQKFLHQDFPLNDFVCYDFVGGTVPVSLGGGVGVTVESAFFGVAAGALGFGFGFAASVGADGTAESFAC